MQPVMIEDSISVAANTVVDNVIVSNPSLSQYLRCPFNARALFMAVISATGLKVQVSYGSVNPIAESDVRVGTDLQAPNDVLNDQMWPNKGDQLIIRANNTTGGAITLRYRMQLAERDSDEQPKPALIMQLGPVSVAAAAVDQQLLNGKAYERPPWDCIGSIFMTASAAGLTRKVNVETVSVAPPSSIPPLNRVPTDPFDLTIGDIEMPGDKLVQVPVSNPTGGAISVFIRTKMEPA